MGGRTEKSLVAPRFLAGEEERPKDRFRCPHSSVDVKSEDVLS